MATSACRYNYHVDTEAALNKQINMELTASHIYLTMAAHFDRDDVALHGLHNFFLKQSDEEREHAKKMIKYQNLRGGRVNMFAVKEPEALSNYESPLKALQFALSLERDVNQSLLALHGIGTSNNDAQFCDFLESEFLKEQVESMKEIADMITNLTRAGEGLGTYLYDRNLLSS